MYLLEQLYQYFEEYYFLSSLGEYENFEIEPTVNTLLVIIGGLCLGMMIATVLAFVQKRVVGSFIRALLSRGAHDEQSALSLADLSLDKNGFIKHELSYASAIRKTVTILDGGECFTYRDELVRAFPEYAEDTPKEKEGGEEEKPSRRERVKGFFFFKKFKPRRLDFKTARFFIPEDERIRASLRFDKKGTSALYLVIAFFLILLVFFLLLRFLPFFVNMLDVSITNIKGK